MRFVEHQRQGLSELARVKHLLSHLVDLDQLRVRDASLDDFQFITVIELHPRHIVSNLTQIEQPFPLQLCRL